MPDLHVVSERSDEEIRKQAATETFGRALRDLTANLIRIVRGAGKPEQLHEQLHNVALAYNQFTEVHGRTPPPHLFYEMLSFDAPELPEDNEDRSQKLLIEHAICRASLQIAASTLVQQERQIGNAFLDLRDRLDSWHEFQKEREKQRRALMRGKRPKPTRRGL